jgi:hypothetical protein
MSASHKTYRVYCYDVQRKVVTADFISAANDQEAIAKATTAGFGSKCELWDGNRLVAQLEDERRSA